MPLTRQLSLVVVVLFLITTTTNSAEKSPLQSQVPVNSIFNSEEFLDESTLDSKILQDWHVDKVTGTTRQKLIEINVAEWWPGTYYRVPVRMIVPLKGKAKGFHITGGNSYQSLIKDMKPSKFESELLAKGVGIVKMVVKEPNQIPGWRHQNGSQGVTLGKGVESSITLGILMNSFKGSRVDGGVELLHLSGLHHRYEWDQAA